MLFVTFLSNSNIWLILFFFLRATCHLSHGCTTSRIHSVGNLRLMKTGNQLSLNTLKKCSLMLASSVPITITVSIFIFSKIESNHFIFDLLNNFQIFRNECDTYCEGNDHYECDAETGEKKCKDGWQTLPTDYQQCTSRK